MMTGREADRSPPSSDEITNAWIYIPYSLWRGALSKVRENLPCSEHIRVY
jgi:hypothetical protein